MHVKLSLSKLKAKKKNLEESEGEDCEDTSEARKVKRVVNLLH